MKDKIASPEETVINMDALQETVDFCKEHHIVERSKQGQLISELEQRIVNRILSDSRLRITLK